MKSLFLWVLMGFSGDLTNKDGDLMVISWEFMGIAMLNVG